MNRSSARVTKHFVRVGGGVVHYRKAGSGPPVVMLHDSPRSSRLHVNTMQTLADRFTIYALDTPGYGLSTPIHIDRPTIVDFANALREVLTDLNLTHAPIYATHTSAKIALEYAVRDAPSLPLLLLDGLSIPTRLADEDFIARYMRPFQIDASGGYLAAEWTRTRDMLRWFPWFDTRPGNRMRTDPPSAEWIDAYLLDLLSAGPHYSDAYAAAMRYDPRDALRGVKCRTIVAARENDVLYACLDLIPADRSEQVTVHRLPCDHDRWLGWLADALGSRTETMEASPRLCPAVDGPTYIDLKHGQMLVRRAGIGGNRPLLILEAPTLLHAKAWQDALSTHRRTLVPELPGYGESDPLIINDIASHVDALAEMLDGLGIGCVDVLAIGLASTLASAFAARHPDKISNLACDGIAPEEAWNADRLCPEFRQEPAGGHLHRIWHMLRDGEAQWPWNDGGIDAQRRLMPLLDGVQLHAALLDILKQPQRYGDAAHACLASPMPDLAAIRGQLFLFDHPGDAAYAGVSDLAAQLPQARLIDRPTTIAEAAAILDAALMEDPENSI